MWGNESLKQNLAENKLKILELEAKLQILTTAVASLRGLINKKVYKGKLTGDEPDWLDDNMELLGIKQKDKNPDVVGM